MDLLCTENIMHEYETEILCHHHEQEHQQQQKNSTHEDNKDQHLNNNNNTNNNNNNDTTTTTATTTTSTTNLTTTSPPSLYSSNSSLLLSSATSCCSSTNSSGYNSSSSSTSSSSCLSSSKNPLTSSNNSSSSGISSCYSSSSTGNNNCYHNAKLQCDEDSNEFVDNLITNDTNSHNNNNNNNNKNNNSYQQQQQQQHHHNSVYVNNLINRSLDYVNTATEDPTFLTDRCLENALKAEEKRPQAICIYFNTVQKDITPPMRKIVAEWMMEVCAEEKCQEEVVLLALNYMDRFLSTKTVRKTHLQILAAACLLIASKLREPSCRALSAELLVFYTDNSIHKADLIKWELYVLSRLGWDLSCVTPLDFLELLLIRLPIRSSKFPDLDLDKVRQHAQAFISLAAKEHHFSMYSASTIAASSIAAALSGLNWHLRTGQNLRYLLNLLTDLTSVEQDYLHDCMMKMETIFEEHSRNLQPYLGNTDLQHHSNNSTSNSNNNNNNNNNNSTSTTTLTPAQSQFIQNNPQYLHYAYHHHHHHSGPSMHHHHHHHQLDIGSLNTNNLLPNLTQTCKMQANAQKEVQDIKF
ncbi:cyclin D [Cochliomyia hominivorax]